MQLSTGDQVLLAWARAMVRRLNARHAAEGSPEFAIDFDALPTAAQCLMSMLMKKHEQQCEAQLKHRLYLETQTHARWN